MKKTLLLLLAFLASGAMFAQDEDEQQNWNVIVGGVADHIELQADYPFAAPEGFTASSVTIRRNVKAGTATFCLPFAVSTSEVDANGTIGTFHHIDNASDKVLFETQTSVDANTPFLMKGFSADATSLAFTDKTIVATPATLGDVFVGTYDGLQSGEGKWGIGNATTFMRGGSAAKIRSFQAYLTDLGGSASARELAFMDDATGIEDVSLSEKAETGNVECYTIDGRKLPNGYWSMVNGKLRKGVYIVNGKKVIVK